MSDSATLPVSLPAPPTREASSSLFRQVQIAFRSKFKVIEAVGSGGYGTVYKVKRHITDTVEALKVLNPDLLQDSDQRRRFEEEFKWLRMMRNKHVVSVY